MADEAMRILQEYGIGKGPRHRSGGETLGSRPDQQAQAGSTIEPTRQLQGMQRRHVIIDNPDYDPATALLSGTPPSLCYDVLVQDGKVKNYAPALMAPCSGS